MHLFHYDKGGRETIHVDNKGIERALKDQSNAGFLESVSTRRIWD